jgi:hypothetical protein
MKTIEEKKEEEEDKIIILIIMIKIKREKFINLYMKNLKFKKSTTDAVLTEEVLTKSLVNSSF